MVSGDATPGSERARLNAKTAICVNAAYFPVGCEMGGRMEFDSETLFNAAAAAVSTVAVTLFILDHQFPYSPVSKVVLVVAFLGGVFALTQSTDDDQLTLLGYGVIVISALVLVLDLTNRFDVGTTLQVVVLLGMAMVLFGLRMRLGDRSRFISGTRATQLFGALVVLAALVLTVDVVTGGLAYELQTQSEVEFSGGREPGAQIGSVVVTNPGPFPERVDLPHYGVCTAGDWSAYQVESSDGEARPVDAHLRIERQYGQHVFGFGEKRYPAIVQVHAEGVEGERFLVQRTDECPDDESGDPYLAVFERGERYPYRTPV